LKNRVKRKSIYAVSRVYRDRRYWMTDEEYAWETMAPIGREFGSPDFYRLRKIEVLAHGAIIERCTETGLFVGYVPGIVGAHAQGETRQEVISHLQDILGMLSSRYQGRPVRRDPRRTVPDHERWLFDPIPVDILTRAIESIRSYIGNV
jgi:hypothetical protein